MGPLLPMDPCNGLKQVTGNPSSPYDGLSASPCMGAEEAVSCQGLCMENPLSGGLTPGPQPLEAPRLCLREAAPCGYYSYLFSGSLHIYYSTKQSRQLRPLVFTNRKLRPGEGKKVVQGHLGSQAPWSQNTA